MKKMIQHVLIVSMGCALAILLLLFLGQNIIEKQNNMVKTSEILFGLVESVGEKDQKDSALLAIDKNTYEIIDSSNREMVGKQAEYIGISHEKMVRFGKGFHFKDADGKMYYGVFRENGNMILGHMIPVGTMYRGIVGNTLFFIVAAAVIFGIIFYVISKYVDEKIMNSVAEVNQKLQMITEGDLNVKMEVESIPEVQQIGEHINEMVDLMRRDLYQDQLTGLYSRRAFYYELEKYFSHVNKDKVAALIMVDADYLKYVNDVYGHETGDEYLRRITELMSRISCKDKLMARLGGDEFAVLIPDAGSEDKLQEYYEECMQLREGVKLTISDQLEIPILFSVGMAMYPKDGDNYHVLLKEADNRMFQDKQERKKKANRQK